jgi:glucosyl-dolichyl phosphate glucuronosyltransferase
MEMKASVLICTHNRASHLREVLEGLVYQAIPHEDFEVLVVDNASTDNTQAVACSFQNKFPHFRCILEKRLGVAVARNRGAREAKGDIIVYYDDDQFLQSDSLGNLLEPFTTLHPAPQAVMGRVELRWEGGKSGTFPERFETLLSRFDQGNAGHFLGEDAYFLSMNLAIRRNILLDVGGFREDLSRVGNILLCSADNELYCRLITRGYTVYYEPSALVHHWVSKERQTKYWLYRRLYGEGMSQAIMDKANANDFSEHRRKRDLINSFRRTIHFFFEALLALCLFRRKAFLDATYKLVERIGRLRMEWSISVGRHAQRIDSWRNW